VGVALTVALVATIGHASDAGVPATQAVVSPPGCATSTAPASKLKGVEARFISGLGEPFGVAVSRNSEHAFVADAAGRLYVYSLESRGLVAERVGALPGEEPLGLTLTPNGRYLVAAQGSGASVFDVAQLERKGSRSSTWTRGIFRSAGEGAIESAVSPDGNFVFVTLEDSDELAVFNLKRALARGFRSSDLVGTVSLGIAPVGVAVSVDGRYLYVTSEAASRGGADGELTTIDLKEAERSPSRAVVSSVPAGCSPVRVATTRSTVYVTARRSDAVLAFSATDLVANPGAALERDVQVGEAPVGLALIDHGKMIVVSDSDRFAAPGAGANLAVVSIASDGRLTLAGYVRSGSFPRDMAVSPNDKMLLVSNFGSGQIETVGVGGLS
jgi:DNA-binding beta-propeller fold protein YncE